MFTERTASDFAGRFGFLPTKHDLEVFNGRGLTKPVAEYYRDWHSRRVPVSIEKLRSGHVVQTVQCKDCAGNVRLKVG